ncbi:MAG: patatin-like phospholipase family protein [Lapillicoccus sp.]
MAAQSGPVAFVLGGGGILGASEVGMLEALLAEGIRPDLVVGTSVGAVNGAFLATDPTPAAVDRLAEVWVRASESGVFTDSLLARVQRVGRLASHLHSSDVLESLLADELDGTLIEDLAVRFQCVAAQIETASARWFDRGSVVDAVLASCAVPGLLPAEDEQHVLPPRPGGVVAALSARPDLDVVVLVHAGLDLLVSPVDIWDAIPVEHQPMSIHWWIAEAGTIPSDRDGIVTWVDDIWGEVDAWVEAELELELTATPAPPAP